MKSIYYFLERIFEKSTLEEIFPNGCQWTLPLFLERLNWHNIDVLKLPQEAILQQPLVQATMPSALPEPLQLLITVFYEGRYSNDDYFTIDGDKEPATELLHGLEFATYALKAGAPDADIIAGLFHDVARFYQEPAYANKHHHTDGYQLLKAFFGAPAGYFCLFHGLAKAKLYDAVSDYPDDMTNVSMKTLVLQRAGFDDVVSYLEAFKSEKERQYVILKSMFFRVFDDSSKYPEESAFHLISRADVSALLLRAYNPVVEAITPLLNTLSQGLCRDSIS